jgi:hypothetical protein
MDVEIATQAGNARAGAFDLLKVTLKLSAPLHRSSGLHGWLHAGCIWPHTPKNGVAAATLLPSRARARRNDLPGRESRRIECGGMRFEDPPSVEIGDGQIDPVIEGAAGAATIVPQCGIEVQSVFWSLP